MLQNATNADLCAEWLESIEATGARAAFCYLLGIAASSRRFVCHPERRGSERDFRFVDVHSREQLHSFTTTRHWLLFYFRLPAIRTGAFSRQRLAEDFDSFIENAAGEWTVRLANVADIDVLSRHVAWTWRDESAADPPMTSEQRAAADALTPAQIQKIDAALLAHVRERWRKVATVVAMTMNNLENRVAGIPDVYYAARLKALITSGRIEARGDLSRMRFSDVRLRSD